MGEAEISNFYPVILAGGRGTRFWPLSRKRMAKQLLPLNSEKSMIQETVERLEPLAPGQNDSGSSATRICAFPILQQLQGSIRVRCWRSLSDAIRRRRLGWRRSSWQRRDPNAVIGMFPSDHVIQDEAAFARDIERAARDCARRSEHRRDRHPANPRRNRIRLHRGWGRSRRRRISQCGASSRKPEPKPPSSL